MNPRLLSVFSEVPAKPEYYPVRDAIEGSKDRSEVLAALKLFSSMPQSTAVFANPVRHLSLAKILSAIETAKLILPLH
jgi:hypothetical protein